MWRMKDLIEIREEIDDIDSQIIKLYEKRMELTTEVAEYKISVGKQVLDKKRESEKLDKAEAQVQDEKNRYGVRELFEQIMAMSRKRQYQLLVGRGLGEKTEFELVDKLPFENGKIVYQETVSTGNTPNWTVNLDESVQNSTVSITDGMNLVYGEIY